MNTTTLKKTVKEGILFIKKQPNVIEGLVYASANRRSIGRLVYTTHIPCNGLEELKSDEDLGICVEIWINKGGKKLVGFGHEPNECSPAAVKRAFEKAKRDAVADPEFQGFWKPEQNVRTHIHKSFHDKKLLTLTPKQEAAFLSKLSWDTINGATDELKRYAAKNKKSLAECSFILNGDTFIITEQMALATTSGVADSDESTILFSFLTAMFEKEFAKGSAWGVHTTRRGKNSALEIGKAATQTAIRSIGSKTIKSGSYDVVFGPQAVTELFGNLLLPNLNLGLVDFGASMFTGAYGQTIASPLLTLYDDASLPGSAGSKRITCEGCPTGKTMLIDQGKLVGYLSDFRTTTKILQSKHAKKQLGVDPHEIRHAISPRNGFRFAEGGGRVAGTSVGIHATNLVVTSPHPSSEKALLKKVRNGLYIGRLWYTYPMGGMSTGIISGTVIADSFVIRNGKLAEPIRPNALRLEDNIGGMVRRILGIGNNQTPTILWASDEITHAPWVAMEHINFISTE